MKVSFVVERFRGYHKRQVVVVIYQGLLWKTVKMQERKSGTSQK